MIKMNNITKSFGNLAVLKGLNAQIEQGEVIGIIGGSGSGKSVFLRSVALLHPLDQGEVWIDGIKLSSSNINSVRQKIGMVYQEFNLFSHLNVLENIILAPMKVLKISREKAVAKARALLEMVELPSKELAMPCNLSGGQKQRIAIARSIAMDPKVILLDEPSSALDPRSVSELLSILANLKNQGMTMLIVSHEMNFVASIADRIFYVDEGIIYESGKPEQLFHNPQKAKTIAFIRKLKEFSYTIDGDYNFADMKQKLLVFLEKYRIPYRDSYRMCLLTEELLSTITNNINYNENLKISIKIEYLEDNHDLKLSIFYPGENIDATIWLDEIATALVNGCAHNIEHSFAVGENCLVVFQKKSLN